jgi:hypothetical protein
MTESKLSQHLSCKLKVTYAKTLGSQHKKPNTGNYHFPGKKQPREDYQITIQDLKFLNSLVFLLAISERAISSCLKIPQDFSASLAK